MKFGKGFVSGFLVALFITAAFASGIVVITQDGVSKSTWDYCVALVAANTDYGSTTDATVEGVNLETVDLDAANENVQMTVSDHDLIVATDCTTIASCSAECLVHGCDLGDKNSTVVKAEILQDSDGNDYCSCECADGDLVFITDCADS